MGGYNNAEKAISELCRVKQKGLMSTKKRILPKHPNLKNVVSSKPE